MEKTATLSDCGKYRYRLGRRWSAERAMMWIMLNPSTADSNIDDRTIGRCIGFAKDWGYGAILVGNIFPYRATKPEDLLKVYRWGFNNGRHLREMSKEVDLIVVAWGSNKLVGRVEISNALNNIVEVPIKCLGKTLSGAPLHPLYQPADAQLIEWQSTNGRDGK